MTLVVGIWGKKPIRTKVAIKPAFDFAIMPLLQMKNNLLLATLTNMQYIVTELGKKEFNQSCLPLVSDFAPGPGKIFPSGCI